MANVSNKEMFFACFILLGTFVSSISQVLLKKSAMTSHKSVIREYLNPFVILAYLMFFAATLCTIAAYRVVPLSFGAVLETTGYIYITFFGVTIFHEKLSIKKMAALGIIVFGIIVYSVT